MRFSTTGSSSKVVIQDIIFTILMPSQISFAEVFNTLECICRVVFWDFFSSFLIPPYQVLIILLCYTSDPQNC